ncbi:hypothetical protein [Desulfovibrio inopinatus]|uniref:hypothetical protein n=1 Tax=Desulfovibrio inopinatus TaxID=102109 RepID=UPI00041DCB2D|nr:hypothetical protein [Desulfovibrio inopinatus]
MRDKLIIVLFAFILIAASPAYGTELLPGGDFELGNGHFLILRSPILGVGRYAVTPTLDTSTPLDGRASLQLPPLKTGSYTLASTTWPIIYNQNYTVSLGINADRRTAIKIHVRASGDGRLKQLAQVSRTVPAGRHSITFPTGPITAINDASSLGWMTITIKSPGTVWLDNISVTGPGDASPSVEARLETDAQLGVYRSQESPKLLLYLANPGTVHWSILDYRGHVVQEGTGKSEFSGPAHPYTIVPTVNGAGIFTCVVEFDSSASTYTLSRRFVVLARPYSGSSNDPRFGMSIASSSMNTMAPASVTLAEHYALLRDMGVGSVRNFSLINPYQLSKDGKSWDFSTLDEAVRLAKMMNWEVFFPLGSTYPSDIPSWMRTSQEEGNIDLLSGLRTARLRNQEEKSGKPHYLDSTVYQNYLNAVMGHLAHLGVNYEIWNEPGHKFSVEDTLRLITLAHESRARYAPKARLLGFSSTKGPGRGQGQDPMKTPEFFQQLLDVGAGQLIDVVSYHSGHAFAFLGESQDIRDQETRYASRLARAVNEAGIAPKPMWDTERANPWFSATLDTNGQQNVGYVQDIALDIENSMSSDELAQCLPMIYAAAFADGVDRVYWFNGQSANAKWNAVLDRRWWIWDVMLEPTALIPAYSAMSSRLAGAQFVSFRDMGDATRAYIFQKGQETIIVANNWLGNSSELVLNAAASGTVYGTMGEVRSHISAGKSSIPLDGWPIYVVTGASVTFENG